MQILDLNGSESPLEIDESGLALLSYRGSIAHNMYVSKTDPKAIDDVDLIGIVIGRPEHYLGLQEWGSRGTKEIKQGKYDVVLYEIKKAFRLLLQGNPNVLSLLWANESSHITTSEAGARLLENRGLFVGKHVYDAFTGYAHAQLQKMETRDPADLRMYLAITAELKYRGVHPNEKGKAIPRPIPWSPSGEEINAFDMTSDTLLRHHHAYTKKGDNLGYLGDKRKQLVLEHGYDSKNAAHCIRLLRMGVEFLETGSMTVYRIGDREELLAIKGGKWTLEQVKAEAQRLFDSTTGARDKSPLPEGPDREGAEKLLIEIIRSTL